jgi:HK97 family phage major capsid protein
MPERRFADEDGADRAYARMLGTNVDDVRADRYPTKGTTVSDAAARALAAYDDEDLGQALRAAGSYIAGNPVMDAYHAAKARGVTNEDAIRAAVAARPVPPPHKSPVDELGIVRLVRYLRGIEQKAPLVKNAAGQVMIPDDLTIDILREVRRLGTIRSIASVRPTVRDTQTAGLLGTATVSWGKAETGAGSYVDANVVPEAPAQEIPVHDVQASAFVGVDLLDDAPEAVRPAIVEAVAAAIAESEDAKFAAGSGSNEPSGLALAANVTRVPAAQRSPCPRPTRRRPPSYSPSRGSSPHVTATRPSGYCTPPRLRRSPG